MVAELHRGGILKDAGLDLLGDYGIDSWTGWHRAGSGSYHAYLRTSPDRQVYERWELNRLWRDESGVNDTGWYLFGPNGTPFGELMCDEQGNRALAAAQEAAKNYIRARRTPRRPADPGPA